MSCFICPSPARPASYAAASSRQRSLAALTKQRSRNSTRSGDRAPPASTSRNHAAMSSSDMRPPSPHDATTRRGASANFSRADHGETDGRARVADGGLGKWRPRGWPQVHRRACRQRSCSASCSKAHGQSSAGPSRPAHTATDARRGSPPSSTPRLAGLAGASIALPSHYLRTLRTALDAATASPHDLHIDRRHPHVDGPYGAAAASWQRAAYDGSGSLAWRASTLLG